MQAGTHRLAVSRARQRLHQAPSPHPQGVPCPCSRDHPLLPGYPGMSLAACGNKAKNTTEWICVPAASSAWVCFALQKLGFKAVPPASCDQGLCLIQGRGPGARGNVAVCPRAEMWDLAQGSWSEASRSCSALQGLLPWPGPAGLLGTGVSSLSRGTWGSVPHTVEEINLKCLWKSPGRTDRKWPWQPLLSEHCDYFFFSPEFLMREMGICFPLKKAEDMENYPFILH